MVVEVLVAQDVVDKKRKLILFWLNNWELKTFGKVDFQTVHCFSISVIMIMWDLTISVLMHGI